MKNKIILPLIALVLCLSGQKAIAQSTIMNAPSTDVVAAKKVFLEMDFITNYAWAQGDDRFANYCPRGGRRRRQRRSRVKFLHASQGGGEPSRSTKREVAVLQQRRKGYRGCGGLHVLRTDH